MDGCLDHHCRCYNHYRFEYLVDSPLRLYRQRMGHLYLLCLYDDHQLCAGAKKIPRALCLEKTHGIRNDCCIALCCAADFGALGYQHPSSECSWSRSFCVLCIAYFKGRKKRISAAACCWKMDKIG